MAAFFLASNREFVRREKRASGNEGIVSLLRGAGTGALSRARRMWTAMLAALPRRRVPLTSRRPSCQAIRVVRLKTGRNKAAAAPAPGDAGTPD